jgi:hypothetical protein
LICFFGFVDNQILLTLLCTAVYAFSYWIKSITNWERIVSLKLSHQRHLFHLKIWLLKYFHLFREWLVIVVMRLQMLWNCLKRQTKKEMIALSVSIFILTFSYRVYNYSKLSSWN